MPKSVQIRDVPDEVVATMQTRAPTAGMSMSEYLRARDMPIIRYPHSALLERA